MTKQEKQAYINYMVQKRDALVKNGNNDRLLQKLNNEIVKASEEMEVSYE